MNSHTTINRYTGLFDCSKRAALLVFLALWAVAGFLGCAQRNESQEDDSALGHPLLGVVLRADEASGTLTVEHEDIPGFMPAMTMDFRVRPGDAKMAQPGMRIRARMTRDEDGGFRLERIWPVDEAGAAEMRAAGERLAKQAKALSAGYYYGEGDALPDFALVDQYGRTVTAATLEGKAFVLNFIFTRCTDAKMCPLSTFKMAQLQRLVAAEGLRGLEFLSVTLDPVYDTPGVLRDYADGYGIDGANFRFLTGPKEQVQLMLRSLAVTRIGEGVDIVHSLATVLVDGSRRIVLRSEKSAWEPEAYLEAIRQALGDGGAAAAGLESGAGN